MATLIESELETEALEALASKQNRNRTIDRILAERRAERAAKADKPEPGFQDYFGRTHFPKRAGQ